MTVGVLALQGAFKAHATKLTSLGAEVTEVRQPGHLDEVEALVMPGGESTTMSMLLESSELFDPLAKRIDDGMAVFGTCAGLILLSSEIEDGRPDQRCFGRLDLTVQRNGYGRQIESFETELPTTVATTPIHAVFIRAPRISRLGADVEVLAECRGDAVLVRDGNVLGAAFHPELSEDSAIHRLFLESLG